MGGVGGGGGGGGGGGQLCPSGIREFDSMRRTF